jgi:hypothetical protein
VGLCVVASTCVKLPWEAIILAALVTLIAGVVGVLAVVVLMLMKIATGVSIVRSVVMIARSRSRRRELLGRIVQKHYRRGLHRLSRLATTFFGRVTSHCSSNNKQQLKGRCSKQQQAQQQPNRSTKENESLQRYR